MSDRKYRRRATRNTDYQTFQDFSGIQDLENYRTIPSDDSSHESALPPLDHMESVYSQSPYQLRSSQRFYDQQSTSQRIYNQQPYRSSTSFQHSDAYNANNPSFIFNQLYDSSEIPESENSFQTISNQLYHQSEQGHRRNKKTFQLKSISAGASQLFEHTSTYLSHNTSEDKLKLAVNALLLIEVIVFFGAGAMNNSIGSVFSDAFNATTVGGLYSAVMTVTHMAFGQMPAFLTSNSLWSDFVLWSCSGFCQLALQKYNKFTNRIGLTKPLQIIHSIFFSLTLGVFGGTFAMITVRNLISPIFSLWVAGAASPTATAMILGIIGIILFLIFMSYSIKSLISTIKDLLLFYVFVFIILSVILITEFVDSLPQMFGIALIFTPPAISSTFTTEELTRFAGGTSVYNIVVAIVIFVMYNISAIAKNEDFLV